MDGILLGLETIFPVFFMIGFGFILRKRQWIDKNFMDKSSSIVYFFALPIKMFLDMYNADLSSGFSIKYTVFLIGGTLLTWLIAWGLAVLLCEDRTQKSAFIHCGFRGNFVYVGTPILAELLGTVGIPEIVTVDIFILTLYNFLAIFTLIYYSDEEFEVVNVIKNIITHPMVIGIITGFIAHLIGLYIPNPLLKGVGLIGQLATPLALMLIGAQLGDQVARIPWKAFLSGLYCVVGRLLIMTPFFLLLDLTKNQIMVAFVLFATPAAANSYVMTEKMGGDGDFAAKAVFSGFLLNIITFPIGLALLNKFIL